jgi:chitin synthase
VFDKSMIPMRKFGEYQDQAWQDDAEQGMSPYAQDPTPAYRTSYSPSIMSRAPSAQMHHRSSSPFPATPPYGRSPSHTPFGSIGSATALQLSMPMPVAPYAAWAPSPGSMAGSFHPGSAVGTPSEFGRPASVAASYMDRGRSASIGSQLSAFRSNSPFMATEPMPSPNLSSEPTDQELKEAVRVYLLTQDLMKVTKVRAFASFKRT